VAIIARRRVTSKMDCRDATDDSFVRRMPRIN
jgi:hypothetical protein